MYKGKKVSLVFPAFNEAPNLRQAITSFKKLKIIDEFIVVDNNSQDDTAKIALSCKTTLIKEYIQGYGFAVRKGLKSATGDLIVLCEPDGTFDPRDLKRLLKETTTHDVVTGTRTNQKYINKGANMKFGLRFGNYVLAKIIQILFLTPPLTDCGCSFRILKKKVAKKILPNLTIGGSYLLPEMTLNIVLSGFKIKEIPVLYKKRIGQSKITGSFTRSVLVGIKMAGVISKYFFFSKWKIH